MLSPFTETFSTSEFIVLVWMITLSLEEARQIFSRGMFYYFSDLWNLIDVLIHSIYYAGLVMRTINQSHFMYQSAAKITMGLNAIPIYLRLFRLVFAMSAGS